jgi:hypothetical protein
MPFSNIDKGSKYFNTVLYTGNGSTQSITGVGFQPDWVWTKSRSNAVGNLVHDVLRGTNKSLSTRETRAEETDSPTSLTSFNSDGFSLGSNTGINGSGYTFVSWNWLANGTGSSNTAGTISSTVSANTTSGFSIVSYTGTGANATVGHGLGVAPKVVIVKKRSSGADDWYVNHTSASATAGSYLKLNSTQAVITGSASRWNNTNPTSTLFTIGTDAGLNGSGATYIAYCFAEIKGYSKFGSYTGNGSADGTFVYTGFKPAWVMTKERSGANSWHIHDNKRNLFNVVNTQLKAESSGADDTPAGGENSRDFLSNGFKFRNSDHNNQSGQTYIYMAFAENPFVSSNGIPTTAR